MAEWEAAIIPNVATLFCTLNIAELKSGLQKIAT